VAVEIYQLRCPEDSMKKFHEFMQHGQPQNRPAPAEVMRIVKKARLLPAVNDGSYEPTATELTVDLGRLAHQTHTMILNNPHSRPVDKHLSLQMLALHLNVLAALVGTDDQPTGATE
jgi:hypothetical protein